MIILFIFIYTLSVSSHNFCSILALQCKLGLWKIGNRINDKVRPFSANTNLSPPPLPPRGTPLILAKTFSGETIGRTKICIKYNFRYCLDLHFLNYKIFVRWILRILSLKNLLLSIFLFWNFRPEGVEKSMHAWNKNWRKGPGLVYGKNFSPIGWRV